MKLRLSLGILMVVCAALFVFAHDTANINKLSESVVFLTDGQGHGSGVIVDSNCVLTAKHVAEHMPLTVVTVHGDKYTVIKVVNDPDDDLALVYIDGHFKETPLKFDRTDLKVGEKIFIIGYPMDYGPKPCVLPGTVVLVGYNCPDPPERDVDVVDAHAEPGCSGGPVVDVYGYVRAIDVISDTVLNGVVPVGLLNVEAN